MPVLGLSPQDLVVCCRLLGELLLLILAITFTATMSSLLAIIKVVIMVIGDCGAVGDDVDNLDLDLSLKSFIRSKPPGRRLVTSDIHLLQVGIHFKIICK